MTITSYTQSTEPSGTYATSATDRLIAMLNDPDALFTRDQAIYLLTTGQRWGYEHRVDEENEAHPAATYFAAGECIADLDRVAYRRECDRLARLPRPGDFRGTQSTTEEVR